jgi:hypothetical protein
MHWYNIATVIVAVTAAVLAPVLSYYGTQRATRQQLRDGLDARLDADAAEHRRWLRDRTADTYLDLMKAVASATRAARGPNGLGDSRDREEAGVLWTSTLLARVRLYASETVRVLTIAFDSYRTNWRLTDEQRASAAKFIAWSGDDERTRMPVLSRVHCGDHMQALRNEIGRVVRRELQSPSPGDQLARPRLDSNQRHPVPETGALSAELRGHGGS